jgi:hypothetical protein
MTIPDTAEAAHRVASAAMYGGATLSAGSGATMFLGLTSTEWQVAGVVAGICIGVAGLLANIIFQWLRFRRGD